MGTVSGEWYPDYDDAIDDLRQVLKTHAEASAANRASKAYTTLAAMNADVSNVLDGTLGTLSVLVDGIDQGALFIRIGTTWRLIGGARLGNLSTFITRLSALAAITTWPGATFFDASSGSAGVWTTTDGGYRLLVDKDWVNLSYAANAGQGADGYRAQYKFVPGGVLLRGNVFCQNGQFDVGSNLFTFPAEVTTRMTKYTYPPSIQGSSFNGANMQVTTSGVAQIKQLTRNRTHVFYLDGVLIPLNDA